MKIIGVFGGSGTGKSTVSKMINNKIQNSVILNVDKYMHKEWNNKREEILDALKIEGTDRNKYICNHIAQSVETNKIAVKIIEEKVYSEVMEEIDDLKDKYEYIIIDWYAIPITKLYDVCDYTICVYADYEKRLERLTKRLKDTNVYGYGDRSFWSYEQDAIEKRVKITAYNEYGYTADFMIENNLGLKEIEEQVDKVVKEIK